MSLFSNRNQHRAGGLLTSLALLAGGGTLSAVAAIGVDIALAPPATALQNSLALTPQMGFNNWNSTKCRPEFDEKMIKGIADIFVSKGLKDAGYEYINLDDCWALPHRDGNGDLVADPVRFPSGIKALADYVHSKGLKFGIYSSAGTKTCDKQGFPGSLGYEQQDADLWASWGVDYLKYDNCNKAGVDAQTRYKAMGDALRATGRSILYSICEWGESQPWTWARETGNSWRTTGDISDSWGVMLGIARKNMALAQYAGPGAWNDPDMLEVGNGGMTETEYRTHFSLWAQMAAPLFIGTDLRTATPQTLEILTNKDVIAVDQDPLGRQGTVVAENAHQVVMSKPLADGSRSVTLTNLTATPRTISTTTAAVGIGGAPSYTLKELWSKETITSTGTVEASVPAHGTVMYRVTPSEPTAVPVGVYDLSDLAWTSAKNAKGPVERDHSNGGKAAGDGRPLTINGAVHHKGLGVRANSDIRYYLGGVCKTLTVSVGVDDEVSQGAVAFRIYRDKTLVADSGERTAAQSAKKLTVDLTGGRELRLVAVNADASAKRNAHGDWGSPRLACGNGPSAGHHLVSDLSPFSSSNGYGSVERDRSNGERGSGDGGTLTVGGITYTKGLGTHSISTVTYYLGGTCTALNTAVGIDDEVGDKGSAVFQVFADGVKVADSGLRTGKQGPIQLRAPLTGAYLLTLHVTDGGDGTNFDHADWAAPLLTCF
ncbi:NPCBM/NEW2 domain-containing protein [Streptomyces sp. MSC1_001]|jgi:alpha-galactosidase|uniref:NPCBM/NEW2 domain-containing protein n=1 Tax=Streptomyces sp. MSC1_001 TaxID=2909263 RepID=UPI0035B4DBE6